MRVIVTGGEGFIGKALVSYLRKCDIAVCIVDRKIGIEAKTFFSTVDISDVDCVYHLAAQTSVFNENLEQIRVDNIETFMVVCDACKRAGVKLVYASSSTANPGNTTSLYGISKYFDEEYARCYNPSATGIRFHNVYGPNPRQGTLLWCLLNQEQVKLYNEGRNIRHFTYIDDIVESLIFAYGCNRQLINAVNPEKTSTLQFATLVGKYKHLDIELIRVERNFDRKQQSVNESVYTVPLSYMTIEEGVRRIFEQNG